MKMLNKMSFAALMLAGSVAFAATAPVTPAPVQEAKKAAPEVSDLEMAYKKEFAFLDAQKRDLQNRLTKLNQSADAEFAKEQKAISAMEETLIGSNGQVNTQKELLLDAERLLEANQDNKDAFESTFLQADATLEKYALKLDGDKTFIELDDGKKVTELFRRGNALIKRLSSVTREKGSFHLADGTKTQGEIINLGNVAVYGISPQGSGVLAPAGEGLLKLWTEPASAVVTEFAAGAQVATLPLFLIENRNVAVSEDKEKTLSDIMRAGGVVGWVIVVLGIIALMMVIARAIFLKRASQASGEVMEAIRPYLEKGDIQGATATAKKFESATARVVRATVRNLDREREHLEDIISESILHESEHLDRFGTTILVFAAVAPLLGLLGTVTGMISTFDIITEFGTGDPKMLSGGISEALVTTEFGLIVAIPGVLLGNLLSGWAQRIKNDMEIVALRITNIFTSEADKAAIDKVA